VLINFIFLNCHLVLRYYEKENKNKTFSAYFMVSSSINMAPTLHLISEQKIDAKVKQRERKLQMTDGQV